jgi:hypothetical protein
MERLVTEIQDKEGAGNRFRTDHPAYFEMHKFLKDQGNLFEDESIACFCGD